MKKLNATATTMTRVSKARSKVSSTNASQDPRVGATVARMMANLNEMNKVESQEREAREHRHNRK